MNGYHQLMTDSMPSGLLALPDMLECGKLFPGDAFSETSYHQTY